MRKFLGIMFAVMFLLTGCGEVREVQADVAPVLPPDPIEEKLNSMTLEEKVGQMVMIGVYGTELNDDINCSMNNYHFGGVIFYDRNLESVAQAKKFADDIAAAFFRSRAFARGNRLQRRLWTR